jgi:hypothetical protein
MLAEAQLRPGEIGLGRSAGLRLSSSGRRPTRDIRLVANTAGKVRVVSGRKR